MLLDIILIFKKLSKQKKYYKLKEIKVIIKFLNKYEIEGIIITFNDF